VEKPRVLDYRYYQLAGITIRLESDLPISEKTFHPMFKLFEVDGPGNDTIIIRHHFFMPDLGKWNMGKEVYRKPPWAIYKKGSSWVYIGISGRGIWGAFKYLLSRIWHRLYTLKMNSHQKKGKVKNTALCLVKTEHIKQLAIFNHNYSNGKIYNKAERFFQGGNLHSLTLFPTDQVFLAQVLAEREGCYIHASGVVLDGKGLLFVGHSNAGKSTMAMMLKDQAKILCDDRMIVRRWPDGFKIHGTWSHGDVSDVAADSAPLKAILFLKQDRENRLIHMEYTQDIIKILLACLIKPLVTADWWEKMLLLMNTMAHEVPCYTLHFNKNREVIDLLRYL
jgi:hypothetical protein